MTTWTYTYHRFDDEAAYLAACDAAQFARDDTNKPIAPTGSALDAIGTIYKGGEYAADGSVLVPPVALSGYHVNAAWTGEVPAAWAASRLDPEPNTPSRVWA